MLPIRRKRALTPLRSKYAPVPYECTPLIVRPADRLNREQKEEEKKKKVRDSVIRNNEALLPFYRAVGTRRDVELSLSGKILSRYPLSPPPRPVESRWIDRRIKQFDTSGTRERRDSRSLGSSIEILHRINTEFEFIETRKKPRCYTHTRGSGVSALLVPLVATGKRRRRRRRIKERELVYRSRRDTGWRINNCITDRGGQITSKVAGEKDRNPFRGLPDKAARINAHISIIIAGAL